MFKGTVDHADSIEFWPARLLEMPGRPFPKGCVKGAAISGIQLCFADSKVALYYNLQRFWG